MKKTKLFIATATIFLASAFIIIKPVNWKVKDKYSVKFSSGHAEGYFKGLQASISFDEANPEKSKIIAFIDATTLNTGNDLMTEHAKDKDGLHTAKFPVISFMSTAIKKTATGYEATGVLTLKGITKEIKFPFVFDSQKTNDKFPFVEKETFSGKITIAPKDFNITREGAAAQVYIELTIPVTNK